MPTLLGSRGSYICARGNMFDVGGAWRGESGEHGAFGAPNLAEVVAFPNTATTTPRRWWKTADISARAQVHGRSTTERDRCAHGAGSAHWGAET